MTRFSLKSVLASWTIALLLLAPAAARPQNHRGCAWPIELSPEGWGNYLAPEILARYWAMPFQKQDGTMTIEGTYPDARYFSFVVYKTNASHGPMEAASHLHDAEVAPDRGTTNPFVKPGGERGTYTVTVDVTDSPATQGAGNAMTVDSDFAWVMLRIYEPTPDPSVSGMSLTGKAPLPTIRLSGSGGGQPLKPCSPANKLDDVVDFVRTFFPENFDLIGDEGMPRTDRLWFAAPTKPPPLLLPNPDNKYIAMFPGNEYQPGRIIVVHGRAPSFPGTYDGAPVWVPAPGFRNVDMRFWSMCNTDLALPVPTVSCTADITTDLEGGHYTVVISDDLLRPDWLDSGATWLPWGDAGYLKVVFLRNMLPAPGFRFSIQKAIEAGCTFEFNLPYLPDRKDVDRMGHCAARVMGDYYPAAAWCDKSRYVHGGWRACLQGH
jgi:hypothetical protein